MKMEEEFTKNIKNVVKLSKLGVTDIALKIGIHPSMIYDYIKGEHLPNLVIFKKLCEVLGCHYEEILGELTNLTAKEG